MPKSSLKRAAAPDEYESDGGFVEDAPKSKKSKNATSKSTDVGATEVQKDDDGNEFWEISRTRRVQVSEFKGSTMIGIREFYEKDGKALPGKKGISLSLEQYKSVIHLLPAIEDVLKAKGIRVPRPEYDKASAAEKEDAGDEADEDDEAAAEESDNASQLVKHKPQNKANHEATSDEDDD